MLKNFMMFMACSFVWINITAPSLQAQSIDVEEQVQQSLNEGKQLTSKGDCTTGIESLKKAVNLKPTDASLYVLLARGHLCAQHYYDGLSAYAQANKLGLKDFETVITTTGFYLLQNNSEAASNEINEYINSAHHNNEELQNLYLIEAFAELRAKNLDKATVAIKSAIRYPFTNSLVFYFFGLISISAGQSGLVSEELLQLKQTETELPINRFLLGIILFKAERYKAAIELLKGVSSELKNSRLAMALLGEVYYRTGRYDDAITCLRIAADKGLKSYDEYTIFSEMPSLVAGKVIPPMLTQSVPFIKQIMNIGGTYFDVQLSLANSLHAREKYDEELEILYQRLNENYDDPTAFSSLGRVLVEKKEYRDAINSYLNALRVNPNLPGVLLNLGVAYVKASEIEKAIESCTSALSLPEIKIDYNIDYNIASKPISTYSMAHGCLGWINQVKGEWSAAKAEFKAAVDADSNYEYAKENLNKLADKVDPSIGYIFFSTKRQKIANSCQSRKISLEYNSIVRIVSNIDGIIIIGTGWIVKREKSKAWVVTNGHFISIDRTYASPLDISVQIESDCRKFAKSYSVADIIHPPINDNSLDLAVLVLNNVPETELKPININIDENPSKLDALIIGFPAKNNYELTTLKASMIDSQDKNKLFFAAHVSEGLSGSPVVDEKQRIIAMIFESSSLPLDPKHLKSFIQGSNMKEVGIGYPIKTVLEVLQYWKIF